MSAAKEFDAVLTAVGMQPDQQVAVFTSPSIDDGHFMLKLSKYLCPTGCRDAIPKWNVRRLRCHDLDSHDAASQVRKPAQMSPRSGV